MRCRNTTRWLPGILLLALPGLAACQQGGSAKKAGYKAATPDSAPRQPLPFSHRTHVSAAALKCADCHTGARKAEAAGIPGTGFCMTCHVAVKRDSPHIQALVKLDGEKKAVPWTRIYRVPGFVFFSHASHTTAGVACGECHGAVERREVLYREVGTDMDTCVKCHAARSASQDCALCHQLGH